MTRRAQWTFSTVLVTAALAACGGPEVAAEDDEMGTSDAGRCVPETDKAFCARLGMQCGLAKASDDCGTRRAVECGTCPSGEACGLQAANQCAPAPQERSCVDRVDDDGDGLTDCDDDDCKGYSACAPPPTRACSSQLDCGDIVDEMVTDVCLSGRCQAPGAATWRGEAITAQVSIRLVFGGSLTGPSKPRSAVVRFVDSRRPDGSTLTCAQLKAMGNCGDETTRGRIDGDRNVNQVFRSVYALDFSTCSGTECVFPSIFASVPRGQGLLVYGEAWYGNRELNDPTGHCASLSCAEGEGVAGDGEQVQVTFR